MLCNDVSVGGRSVGGYKRLLALPERDRRGVLYLKWPTLLIPLRPRAMRISGQYLPSDHR